MAAEATLKIVREILSACNTRGDAEIASKVSSMVRVLAQNLNHSDRRVRSAAVGAFSAMTKHYKDDLSSAQEYLKEFEDARSYLAENQNEGDLEQLAILNEALSTLGVSIDDNGDYMDAYFQPTYVEERTHNNRLHGMILRLSAAKKGSVPSDINAAVVQMRMVLVAGVISASLRIERNEAAEEEEGEHSTMAKIFLSVKVSPGDDEFVDDLNDAVVDSTDGKFKVGNVDFWESHSGKDTPAETMEKSTEFSETPNDYDETMYLDDDSQLANRVLGKKGKAAKSRKPWSMFNPSSALGLKSVFNSTDLLEMIEYDSEEAVAARESVPSPKVADEPKPATAAATTSNRFGLLRRLFG